MKSNVPDDFGDKQAGIERKILNKCRDYLIGDGEVSDQPKSRLEIALMLMNQQAQEDCEKRGGSIELHYASEIANELDRLTQENQQLREALSGLLDIVGDSQGVAGYHLNGAIAEWGYFDEVDEANQLLSQLEAKDE